LRDPLEVVELRELAGRVIPLTGVVAMHPGGGGGERLGLELVLPPAGADRQPVAPAEHHDVAPELLEPHSALTLEQALPVQRPAGLD
jgi:hypothetical protein